ncbi:unnamed protein product [Mesocestoides corti]|uniref:Uncharacterized protein n=2 Tax=Mesocestoides corti TaxID=53468 RepID=A0A0R3U8A6_MESCO|nr:unnamed protein product [Mesocestoides corti]
MVFPEIRPMSFRFNSRNDTSPNASFTEATKKLARTYYPLIYVDKRRLAKSIIDVQASFEVCFDSLEEIDRLATEVESLNYAIYGLEQALSRAVAELGTIRDEVQNLTIALKASEQFNLRLYEQLMIVDRSTTDGIECSQQTLETSRSYRFAPVNMMDKYRIPKATEDALSSAACDSAQRTHTDVTASSLIAAQHAGSDHQKWVARIQHALSSRHAEFSFLTIGLWTEEVCSNHYLRQDNDDDAGCFGRKRRTTTSPNDTDLKSLLLAHQVKIDDVRATLSTIQKNVHDLGEEIFEELKRQRTSHDDAKNIHRALNSELGERRGQLVENLLATHHAVQTLLEMDEQNNGLVGKLIKSRPLFAELQDALVRGSLVTSEGRPDANQSSFQMLPEVLGPQGWAQLLDKLRSVRLYSPRSKRDSTNTSTRHLPSEQTSRATSA